MLGVERHHKIRCICTIDIYFNFITSISSTRESQKKKKKTKQGKLQDLSRAYNIAQSVSGTRIFSHEKWIKTVQKSQNKKGSLLQESVISLNLAREFLSEISLPLLLPKFSQNTQDPCDSLTWMQCLSARSGDVDNVILFPSSRPYTLQIYN